MQIREKAEQTSYTPPLWRTIPIEEEFKKIFGKFKSSAFRLETLQAYAETSESGPFHQYQRGSPPDAAFLNDWCQMVRNHITSGKAMRRIHVVDVPLSEYMKFEIECCYIHTGAAGEDIRLIDRSKLSSEHLKLITEDFWFFDSSTVMVNEYDERGTIAQARITTDPVIVAKYADIEGQLWPLSTPFSDFYREHEKRNI
jgi:hypothetical protein